MITPTMTGPGARLLSALARLCPWTRRADAGIVADMPNDDAIPVLWTLAEAGRCVGLSRQRMHEIVRAGDGPRPAFRTHWHDDDWALLYRPDDVWEWAAATGRKTAY